MSKPVPGIAFKLKTVAQTRWGATHVCRAAGGGPCSLLLLLAPALFLSTLGRNESKSKEQEHEKESGGIIGPKPRVAPNPQGRTKGFALKWSCRIAVRKLGSWIAMDASRDFDSHRSHSGSARWPLLLLFSPRLR
jgi:hypothetical protein